jgi:chromosome segregation ATPase
MGLTQILRPFPTLAGVLLQNITGNFSPLLRIFNDGDGDHAEIRNRFVDLFGHLETHIADSHQRLKALRMQLDNATQYIQSLQSQHATLAAARDNLVKDTSKLRNQLLEAEASATQARAREDDLLARGSRLDIEHSEVKTNLSNNLIKVGQLQEELRITQARLNTTTAEASEYRKQLHEIRETLEKTNAAGRSLQVEHLEANQSRERLATESTQS